MKEETSLEINNNLKLIGSEGVLDSISLISFAVDLEEKLFDKLNINITIVSEKAFSKEKSPFYDIETLSLFILELAAAG